MLDELGFVECLNTTPLALHGPDVAFGYPLKMAQLSQPHEEHPSLFIFFLAPHLGLSPIPVFCSQGLLASPLNCFLRVMLHGRGEAQGF